MPTKKLLGLVPTLQAAALVKENAKLAQAKKQTTSKIMKMGVKNIVGVSFIKVESDLIASL